MNASKPRKSGCLLLSILVAATFVMVVIVALLFLYRRHQGQVVDRIRENGGAVFTDSGRAIAPTPLEVRSVTLILEKHSLGDFKLITAYPHIEHLSLSTGKLTRSHWDSIAAMQNLENLEIDNIKVGRELSELANCPSLTNLTLIGRNFKDHELAEIKSLSGLRALSIRRTSVTSSGLRCVANLKNLDSLEIQEAPGVTDEGLVHLRDLLKLRSLRLVDIDIDGSGLTHLSKLRKLERVSLFNTRCTSETVGPFISNQKIRDLYLDHTQVDDSIMGVISNLSNLRTLYVESTKITDKGLKSLPSSLNLETVSCTSPVTIEGARSIQKRFPQARVCWQGPDGWLDKDQLFEPQMSDGDEEE